MDDKKEFRYASGVYNMIHEKLQEAEETPIKPLSRKEIFHKDIDIYTITLDIVPSYATAKANVMMKRYDQAISYDITFKREDLGAEEDPYNPRIRRPADIFDELLEWYIGNHWSKESFKPVLCIKATACAFDGSGHEIRLDRPVLAEWNMSYSPATEDFWMVDLYGRLPTLAEIFGKEAAVYDNQADK